MDKKKWFHRPKKKHAMPGERERRKKLLHLLEQGKTIYVGTVANRNAHILSMKKDRTHHG